MSAGELLGLLLRERPLPIATDELPHFWVATESLRGRFSLPLDRAVAGGFVSNRVGFAFASGYQAAVSALVPALPQRGLASFCVTEEGGNHPRAIQTKLEWVHGRPIVTGSKRWCIASATKLIVVATEGASADGRPRLRAVRVDVGTPGVEITPMPTAAVVPEVVHGELRLEGVVVGEEAILPGDGYDEYTKPFRTVEDLHVQAALLGYLTSVAMRFAWPEEIVERLGALIVGAQGFAALGPRDVETHVVLAGFLAQTAAVASEAEPHWALVPDAERERWYRDRALVGVAGKARAKRRERAWQILAREKTT
jgi:acyl-CoA dehydrogenase